MKMLAWEDPFAHSINSIRQREVAFSGRTAQIRGLNLSLVFCMKPVVTLVTFSDYIAMGNTVSLRWILPTKHLTLAMPHVGYMVWNPPVEYVADISAGIHRLHCRRPVFGCALRLMHTNHLPCCCLSLCALQLNLPSVFYALSLLRLPQLFLVYNAVTGAAQQLTRGSWCLHIPCTTRGFDSLHCGCRVICQLLCEVAYPETVLRHVGRAAPVTTCQTLCVAPCWWRHCLWL
jgi:hypothetical protein